MKTPPATYMIKKAAGITKGSAKPHTDKVGSITRKQAEEIATTKRADLTAADMDAAVHYRWFRSLYGHHGGGSVMAKLSKSKVASQQSRSSESVSI
jgi:uncharacterized protein (DUF305 family)